MKIDELLRYAVDKGASDLHLTVNEPPIYRFDGKLIPYKEKGLTAQVVEELVFSILNKEQKEKLYKEKEIDLSYAFEEVGRFRINIYFQKGTLCGAFRFLPAKIKTLKELNLPAQLEEFAKAKQGLLLIVGPTGHGKTTTLASLLDIVNHTRKEHVITIEDPIEYNFTPDKCLINQRELHNDTKSFPKALRSALRQDPNVLLVGEMRDLETVSTAITLAETGHLVMSTLHTNNAAQTLDRMVDIFPPYQQKQVRYQLASTLLGVVSQRLIPRINGGRIVACEILKSTPAIRNLIREEKTYQIENVIQTNVEEGMMILEKSLLDLVRKGEITEENALLYANDPKYLNLLLTKEGEE
jgi:twitching motility protein PilT